MTSGDGRAKIIVQFKDEPAQCIDAGDCVSIGRSPDNSLALSDSKVSRHHAEVRLITTGQYRLSDLGSANGTWLNGRRLTAPRDLQNGDVIQIGTTSLRFEAEGACAPAEFAEGTGTATQMTSESVIVLVTDVRNYTSMTEALPAEQFSRFIRDWFRESTRIIETQGGVIDKFIGDAVMCFWRVSDAENPAHETKMALDTARTLMSAAGTFSQRLSSLFPGHQFRIGAGISMGNAMMGNVGTADNQSITIVGDSVNIAFRLEALTKEKHVNVIVSANLVPWAAADYSFQALGDTEVKGRSKPVSIFALILNESPGTTAIG